MTREEQIRKAARNLTISVSRADKATFAREVFEAGAKWADKNPKSPWISVEEKLPDDGVLVIVAYRWILGEILYASDTFHIDYGWEGYDDIVAWMPIPKLQEE